MSEATVGSKMKNQFFNNYKNLVQDYLKWKDFTMSQIAELRKGVGISEGQTFASTEENAADVQQEQPK